MQVAARLLDRDLWSMFHAQQNEMIITKAGRCLFPILKIDFVPLPTSPPFDEGKEAISSIEAHASRRAALLAADGIECTIALDDIYTVSIAMEPLDGSKWKWRNNQWVTTFAWCGGGGSGSVEGGTTKGGREDSCATPPPEGCSRPVVIYEQISGSDLVHGRVDFESVKISNQSTAARNVITLQSFHRYMPTVRIQSATSELTQCLSFPITEFIAVTHYQNQQTTMLKKRFNPHAKGFTAASSGHWSPSIAAHEVRRSREPRTKRSIIERQAAEVPSSPHGLKGGRMEGRPRRLFEAPPSAEAISSVPTTASDEEELQGVLALQRLTQSSLSSDHHVEGSPGLYSFSSNEYRSPP